MIRKNRGIIFGTSGASRGQQGMRINQTAINPYRAMSNAPTQFGRSTSTHKPIFGQRGPVIRRR